MEVKTAAFALIMLFILVPCHIPYAKDEMNGTGKIAFASDVEGNFDIYVMNADGSHIENITEHTSIETDPAWSPDGKTLAFTRWGVLPGVRPGIYTTSLADEHIELVIEGMNLFPLFSPDGSKIAFVEAARNIWLCLADRNGESNRRLKQLSEFDDRPHTWSPDGKQIAVCDDNGELYMVDVESATWTRVVFTAPNGTRVFVVNVDWSPIRNRLVIASASQATQGIWTANPDGSDVRRLTRQEDRGPEWSPDGKMIAFYGFRDGDWDIYVMDADGDDVTPLTHNSAFDSQPSWFAPVVSVQPSGSLITPWGQLRR